MGIFQLKKQRCKGFFFVLIAVPFGYILTTCSTTSGSKTIPAPTGKDYYVSSQNEFSGGNYDSAYADYHRAVALEKELENFALLNDIMFSWAISQSPAEDSTLLAAQKKVQINPQDMEARKGLVSVAVDKENNRIHIFGIGRAPENVAVASIRKTMASRAALIGATTWIGRLANWSRNGVEGSFDVSDTVQGVTTVNTLWLGEKIALMKVEAPLPAK
jgi:hypothetical protein